VAAFCRDGGRCEGLLSRAEVPRFAQGLLPSADGAPIAPVRWRARGSLLAVAGALPQCLVELDIEAEPTFECQRCLQPVTLPLVVSRRFRFVAGEDEAARLDEELDDDVLALEPRFDLLGLVEDELLLEVPLVPRHETCPDLPAALRPPADGEGGSEGAAEGPAKDGRADHPFAALAALRRRPGG
jgi:uncharacterized protein